LNDLKPVLSEVEVSKSGPADKNRTAIPPNVLVRADKVIH